MVTVAAAQAAPEWMDVGATTTKTVTLIEAAAAQQVEVLALGESWLPGFPWPVLLPSATGSDHAFRDRYQANAVKIDGAEMAAIGRAAARASMHVVMGIAERDGDQTFASLVHIDSSGDVVSRRRKAAPTFLQRAVWSATEPVIPRVHESGVGGVGKIGALSGPENLERAHQDEFARQGEQIHVASWAAFCLAEYVVPPAMAVANAQHYAAENQCVVVLASHVTTAAVCDLAADWASESSSEARALIRPGGGASVVFGPDGTRLTDPIAETDEGFAIAEVQLRPADLAATRSSGISNSATDSPHLDIIPHSW